ncbi:MAG TPA: acyl-CoA desaturase [Solirubrobacteraceae bacterium]|jgi:stearoyl-CoA desaturase (delta-9 desaturase)
MGPVDTDASRPRKVMPQEALRQPEAGQLDGSSLDGPSLDGPSPDGLKGVPSGRVERATTMFITVAPALLLVLAASQAWGHSLDLLNVAIFFALYIPIGLGVTVGFHRLLTHRSFKTAPWLRGLFAILGTMAVEGPVIAWVADHRKHHAYSDKPGDPHSPHGHGEGFTGALRGLLHAHVGWLFDDMGRADTQRYAPDLLADPVVSFVDRTCVLWSLLGLALPFVLGLAIGGSLHDGLTALLWGGAVRIFVMHHVTYSINSICHFTGRRSYETSDHSGNVFWLALLSLGESWHNNHHAFPTSAFHGLRRWEIDFSGVLIATLERLGLAWEVQRIGSRRRASKALAQR